MSCESRNYYSHAEGGGAENIFKDAIPEIPENLEARPPPPRDSGTEQNLGDPGENIISQLQTRT